MHGTPSAERQTCVFTIAPQDIGDLAFTSPQHPVKISAPMCKAAYS